MWTNLTLHKINSYIQVLLGLCSALRCTDALVFLVMIMVCVGAGVTEKIDAQVGLGSSFSCTAGMGRLSF